MTTYNYYKLEINNVEVSGGLENIPDSHVEPKNIAIISGGKLIEQINRNYGFGYIVISAYMGSELQRLLDDQYLKDAVVTAYRRIAVTPGEYNPNATDITKCECFSLKVKVVEKQKEPSPAFDSTESCKDFKLTGKMITEGWQSVE
jgi:hypothetical protein